MNLIASFYNNLFVIEVAVFGIIAAAIFVLLQIVYSQYSYREVHGIFKRIYKNPFLSLLLLFSFIVFILTAVGSLLLSSGPDSFFQGKPATYAILIAFLVLLIIFAVYIFKNIDKIRPSKIALRIVKEITNVRIRAYLLRKYGIPAPDGWLSLLRYGGIRFVTDQSIEIQSDQEQEGSEEDHAQIELERQQFEKRLTENKKEYEKIKKTIETAEDPIEPLDALMLRAISNVDFAAIKEIQTSLIYISTEFINANKDAHDIEEWSPYSDIIINFLKYLVDLLRLHLSMCDKQKLDPVKVIILETSGVIAERVATTNKNEANIILSLWKEIADSVIGKSRHIFNKVVQLYHALAEYAFKNGIEDNESWLDEICRHIGWLGERLISQQGVEEKPVMADHDYYTEYDQLFETLLTVSYEYNQNSQFSYPLIYFDAVLSVFEKLVPILKKNQTTQLKQDMFRYLYVYSSFAEAAIPKGNSRGAALAINYLRRSYEKCLEISLTETAEQVIGLMVGIGGLADQHKDKLEKTELSNDETIDQSVISFLEKSPLRNAITKAMDEARVTMRVNRDYMVEIGKRLKTNFDLNFDWTTGKTYAKDDPRRS